MLLKKLYKFRNTVWTIRVENRGCKFVCKFGETENCKVGICLAMLRMHKGKNFRNFRYIIKEGYIGNVT